MAKENTKRVWLYEQRDIFVKRFRTVAEAEAYADSHGLEDWCIETDSGVKP